MKELNVNGRSYDLHTVRGIVNEASKNMETKVHGGGGGGYTHNGTGGSAPITISSTTVIHDQIFLTDKDGHEHSFQLSDLHVACRQSNEISVILCIKRGKELGYYAVVANHTTGRMYFADELLKGIFRYNVYIFVFVGIAIGLVAFQSFWAILPGMLLGLIVGSKLVDKAKLKRFKADITKELLN